MPAYCSAIVTASSHGAAFGGAYTATFGAFSSGTASMLLASISPRIVVTAPPSTGSVRTPFNAADRKSTRLNSSHSQISYAVFCLKKKRQYGVAVNRPRLAWLHDPQEHQG